MTEELLKTPLYDQHVQHGGKIVPFAGYLLPVQYEAGVMKEHRAVREGVGLFDVSHMGEVTFKGPDALSQTSKTCSAMIFPHSRTAASTTARCSTRRAA